MLLQKHTQNFPRPGMVISDKYSGHLHKIVLLGIVSRKTWITGAYGFMQRSNKRN
jgi:hypothetical protein